MSLLTRSGVMALAQCGGGKRAPRFTPTRNLRVGHFCREGCSEAVLESGEPESHDWGPHLGGEEALTDRRARAWGGQRQACPGLGAWGALPRECI